MDAVYSMNKLTKIFITLFLFIVTQNVFAWGSCGLTIQGPTKVCLNQTVDLLAKKSGADDSGDCRWSNTPGITEGLNTLEGCEATFSGTQVGEFWVTGNYEKQFEFRCHDVTKLTVVPDVTGASCCEIKDLVITPTTILPRQDGSRVPLGPKEAEIKVTLWTPAPVGGCPVELKAEAPFSRVGGHTHDTTGNAPTGDLTTQLLLIPEGDVEGTATYSSSFASGTRRLVVNIQGFTDVTQRNINVNIPNLVNLPAGPSYRLTGVTSAHTSNHYGLNTTNAATTSIANSFMATENATIGINDMSLREGGIFDIRGNWGAPHRSHRKGTSVDIDRCAQVVGCPANNPGCNVAAIVCSIPQIVNGRRTRNINQFPGFTNFSRAEMTNLCTAVGGFVVREPTHHCEIP